MSDEEDNNRKFKRCKIPDNSYPEILKFARENCQEIEIYDISDDYDNNISFAESSQLAEMIGIILGDGHISREMYKFSITSDGEEEIEYIQYTKKMMEDLTNQTPKIRPHKDSNAIDLVIYGKNVIKGFVEKGLKPGDKVKNQVRVPEWINRKPEYQRGCLKGLTDTDGSIFIKKAQKSIYIGFQNHSKPLVEDFKELSENLDIKTGDVTLYERLGSSEGKIYKQYDVLIAGKSEVCKFLETIKPMKWENRAETLGLTLISLKDPQKRESIEKELNELYPDKRVHYTDEYKNHLKQFCEKNGYDVSYKSIFKELESALSYDLNYRNIPYKDIVEFNNRAKKLINDFKQRLK